MIARPARASALRLSLRVGPLQGRLAGSGGLLRRACHRLRHRPDGHLWLADHPGLPTTTGARSRHRHRSGAGLRSEPRALPLPAAPRHPCGLPAHPGSASPLALRHRRTAHPQRPPRTWLGGRPEWLRRRLRARGRGSGQDGDARGRRRGEHSPGRRRGLAPGPGGGMDAPRRRRHGRRRGHPERAPRTSRRRDRGRASRTDRRTRCWRPSAPRPSSLPGGGRTSWRGSSTRCMP